MATYAALRSARMLPQEDRVNCRWHWHRFPFSLRRRVLWSPILKAWFCPEEEVAIEHMLKLPDYEPVDWVDPQPGDVFIDVGAYSGWYSIRASRRVGPSGRVVALEPDSNNRRQLERNIALNQLPNVSVVPAAAWSKSGRVGWHASDVAVWHSVSEADSHSISVEAVAIDDIVRELKLPRVDWIKMDIEGAEVGALAGAGETLERFHPALFIELHETVDSVSSFLDAHEYQTVHLRFDQEPRKHGWILARQG